MKNKIYSKAKVHPLICHKIPWKNHYDYSSIFMKTSKIALANARASSLACLK
jgi:hypothetical protein